MPAIQKTRRPCWRRRSNSARFGRNGLSRAEKSSPLAAAAPDRLAEMTQRIENDLLDLVVRPKRLDDPVLLPELGRPLEPLRRLRQHDLVVTDDDDPKLPLQPDLLLHRAHELAALDVE